MPEIFGIPAGMAVRRLGFGPQEWQDRMDLRAQVVRGLQQNPVKRANGQRDGRTGNDPGKADHSCTNG